MIDNEKSIIKNTVSTIMERHASMQDEITNALLTESVAVLEEFLGFYNDAFREQISLRFERMSANDLYLWHKRIVKGEESNGKCNPHA